MWPKGVVPLLRAALFDLGETLVRMNRPWEEVFRANLENLHRYLVRIGLNSDFPRFARTFIAVFEDASAVSEFHKIEIPMEEILSRVLKKLRFDDQNPELVHEALAEYFKPEIEAWDAYPDSTQTLAAVRDAGLEMALVSNAKSDWAVRAIVRKCDFESFFRAIFTSAAVRVRKPRSEIFLEGLKAVNAKPAEAVFIGDSLGPDIIGAKMLGMRTIHVLRRPPDLTCATGPDATVGNLAEVLGHIEKWNAIETGQWPQRR